MMIAHVVPVRRLPHDRRWFDYRVPADFSIQPGQLVHIPFGRQTLSGVVWELTNETTLTELKPLSAIVGTEPVTTAWQRDALGKMADWYFVSLGTLVASALPTFLKRLERAVPTVPPTMVRNGVTTPTERVWWYRDRAATVKMQLDWLLKDVALRVICLPTIEEFEDYRRAAGPEAAAIAWLDSTMTPRAYRHLYEQVRLGKVKKIIGTSRIFFLPYPETPRLLLDQEDHPAHHQLEQHPRLDNRQLAAMLQPQAIVTTASPSISTMVSRHPSPPPFRGLRQLVSLNQPGSQDWLTPDIEQVITSTVSLGNQVLAIVPHHGFAQRVACRECGWTLVCPTCQQRIRLDRFAGTTAQCGACGHQVAVPLKCPRCQATRWALSGLGVEQFAATLRRRWPKIMTTIAGEADHDHPGVIVGTYQAHRLRRTKQKPVTVIVISGDALLSYPDFSVAERAWTYLARLQSDQPNAPVIVQTYEPDLPFWQRWRHGDDRSWYNDELQQRQHLGLPPYADHWIVYGHDFSATELTKKQGDLVAALPKAISVSILEPAKKRRWGRDRGGRLLVQAPVGVALRPLADWHALLPTPWQIDPAIRGWTE